MCQQSRHFANEEIPGCECPVPDFLRLRLRLRARDCGKLYKQLKLLEARNRRPSSPGGPNGTPSAFAGTLHCLDVAANTKPVVKFYGSVSVTETPRTAKKGTTRRRTVPSLLLLMFWFFPGGSSPLIDALVAGNADRRNCSLLCSVAVGNNWSSVVAGKKRIRRFVGFCRFRLPDEFTSKGNSNLLDSIGINKRRVAIPPPRTWWCRWLGVRGAPGVVKHRTIETSEKNCYEKTSNDNKRCYRTL